MCVSKLRGVAETQSTIPSKTPDNWRESNNNNYYNNNRSKEREKTEKCQDLGREIRKLWKVKAFGTILRELRAQLERIGIRLHCLVRPGS